MRKIRVAFFADTLQENIDGAVRTMYQIINRIPSERFEFLFIVGEKPQKELKYNCLELPSVTLPFNSNYKMAISTFSRSRLESQLSSFSPDIIHIATPSILGSYALSYAERNNIPRVTIYHTHFLSYVEYYLKNFPLLIKSSKNILIAHMQSFYNRCDRIYVPSNAMISELSSIGVLSNKMVLWKRGLDTSLFTPLKRTTELFDNSTFKILFASRLVWEKNLDTLISIYERSLELNLPYKFIIAGDGCARKAMMKAMPEAVFLGELDQSELSKVYASSDVFLFPSISETYGNVVVEAMASGLPCVIARGGGTNDFIKHKSTGLICSFNDVKAYIDSIESIRSDSDLRNRIVSNALDYAQGMSWTALVNAYFADLENMSHYQEYQVA